MKSGGLKNEFVFQTRRNKSCSLGSNELRGCFFRWFFDYWRKIFFNDRKKKL